ncbi:MAG: methyl-accepting chemotaxis protein [Ignavibacteriales bacterium]
MKKQKIQRKLTTIFTILILFSCALVYAVSLVGFIRIQKNDALEKLETISELGYSYLELTYLGDWSLSGENLYKGKVLINNNYKIVDELKEKTGAYITIFAKDKRVSTNVLKADSSRAIGTAVSSNVAQVVLQKGEIYKGAAKVVEKQCESIYKPLKNAKGEIVGIWFVGVTQDSINKEINQNIVRFSAWVIFIMVVCIILSIISAVFFTRNIVKGVNSLKGTMKKVEEKGDLTSTVDFSSQDEIGEVAKDLNNMIGKLRTIFKQVADSSDMVLHAAEQMGSITQNIDKLSQQQNSSADETHNLIEELDIHMQDITKGIEEVSRSVGEVAALLEKMEQGSEDITVSIMQLNNEALNTISATAEGKNAVEISKEGMDIINTSVGNLIGIVKDLGQSTDSIGEIVNVIDDISGQTNLLALNAAIEAARAGEHGRGFSIVAESISSLAEKSVDATKEIGRLIKSVQEKLLQAVEASNIGAVQIQKGVDATSDLERVFLKIKEAADNVEVEVKKAGTKTDEQVSSIRKAVKFAENVSKLTQGMAETVKQQANESTEVVKAVENISDSANLVASGTGKIASSADSLAKESQKLASIISDFKLD